MHVLHYVPNFFFPTGGREIFVIGLVRKLQKFDIEQSVLTNSADGRKHISRIDGKITIYSTPQMNSAGYRILRNITDVLSDKHFDIISIHGYGEYTGDMSCLLRFFGYLKSPLVLSTYGVAGLKHGHLAFDSSTKLDRKQRFIRMCHLLYDYSIEKFALKYFDKITINSIEEWNYLDKLGVSKDKVVNIPIAIDDIFFSPTHFKERQYILYAGRFDRFKGLDTLVRSIHEASLLDKGVKLILVGIDAGYKRKIEELIVRLRMQERIKVIEKVSQAELLNFYGSAIATVLPSYSEGFPLSLAESMARGTPFISTPVGAIPEIVTESQAGILVPIANEKELASNILRLVRDKELWSRMSMNGIRYASNFRWEKIASQFYSLYRGLL